MELHVSDGDSSLVSPWLHLLPLPLDSGWGYWSYLTYLYLGRLSSGMSWVEVKNGIYYVSDGGTPGSTVLGELTWKFHLGLFPSPIACDSRPRERFVVLVEVGWAHPQLVSSSIVPRLRRCWITVVSDQFTFRAFRRVTKIILWTSCVGIQERPSQRRSSTVGM